MNKLPFDHQSVKPSRISSVRSSRTSTRSRRSKRIALRIASRIAAEAASKPGSGGFEQAAVSVLERLVLFLVRHLHDVPLEKRLILAVSDVRHHLGLAQPFFALRDWPEDQQVSDALEKLVTRLSELEPTE